MAFNDAFVTLDEVKARLRIDNDDEDQDLQDMIYSCTSVVKGYIQDPTQYTDSAGSIPVDSSGNFDVDPAIKLGTLILIGIMYRDRDGTEQEKWQHGYLPFPVTSVLYRFRVPSHS